MAKADGGAFWPSLAGWLRFVYGKLSGGSGGFGSTNSGGDGGM